MVTRVSSGRVASAGLATALGAERSHRWTLRDNAGGEPAHEALAAMVAAGIPEHDLAGSGAGQPEAGPATPSTGGSRPGRSSRGHRTVVLGWLDCDACFAFLDCEARRVGSARHSRRGDR